MKNKKDNRALASTTEESLVESDDVEQERKLQAFNAMLETGNVWGHDKKGVQAIRAAMSMLSTKTGMYSRIPIYCKGESCPYDESCPLRRYGIEPHGQACPIEIAQIQKKYTAYARDFDLETEDASETDRSLVAEIIKMEIYMERCDALMSREQSPVQMTVAGVAEDGTPIQSPDVSKAVQAYERFSKKRNEDYSLLMATRRDKKKNLIDNNEPSIIDIMDRATSDESFFEVEKKPKHIRGYDPEPIEEAK